MTTHSPIPSAGPPSGFIPPGFHVLEVPRGFIAVNGPLYLRQDPDDRAAGVALGMLVADHHGNPKGVCHGGMLMAFADIMLAVVVRHAEPQLGMMPTVSMSSDFLAGAPIGSFLTGTGRLLKRTRNLAFAEGRVMADDRLVLRVSGILKIPSRPLVPADRLPAGERQPPEAVPNDDGPPAAAVAS